MNISKNIRIIIVASTSFIICLISTYINDCLNLDAVYTSLFYIPVIMTGLWYYRFAIPLATAFALFFNFLDFISLDGVSIDQIFRGLILILGATVLYYMGKILNNKNQKLKNSEDLLAFEKEKLRIMLYSIGDGVISADSNGNIIFLNKVAKKLTGWFDESAIGKPFAEVFDIINEYTREKSDNPVKRVLETNQIIELANHTALIAKDGTERSIADSAAPICDDNGNVSGVILVFRDITEEKIKQNEIEYLSFHDQLTGLGNRRYLETQLKMLDNKTCLPLSVIMGDANGLKLTNDAFGHTMGDELLQKAAKVLTSVCRNDDIICRYGGDEFVILLPNTNEVEAKLVVKRIKVACDDIEIGPVKFSMSLGFTTKNNEKEDVMDTIKAAENFMYKIKLYESPSTRGNIVQSIMNTLKGNSEREKMHSERSSELCVKIAKAYNLSKEDIERYKTACMFHDIGKIAIDQKILNKVEKLTQEEFQIIKRHPEIGYRILNAIPEFAEISEYVLAHHERWDGNGYPKGLKGEEIPYISRIIAISDSYDAMISYRPYKTQLSEKEAMNEIKKFSGTQFDPNIAKVFVEDILGNVS